MRAPHPDPLPAPRGEGKQLGCSNRRIRSARIFASPDAARGGKRLVLGAREDRGAQGRELGRAASEQILGIAAILEDAAVDLDALVVVHAEAGQELEAQVVV